MNNHALFPDFLDPNFVNASSAITPDSFPEIYQGYYWLHRVALDREDAGGNAMPDLQWIVMDQAATGILDFGKLPLATTPPFRPPR